MNLHGKKLGILISAAPDRPNFHHGIRLASAAMQRGLKVYVYCIDDAVLGLGCPELQQLSAGGSYLYACAYALQRRNLQAGSGAILAGLTIVNDLMAATDRFVSFN